MHNTSEPSYEIPLFFVVEWMNMICVCQMPNQRRFSTKWMWMCLLIAKSWHFISAISFRSFRGALRHIRRILKTLEIVLPLSFAYAKKKNENGCKSHLTPDLLFALATKCNICSFSSASSLVVLCCGSFFFSYAFCFNIRTFLQIADFYNIQILGTTRLLIVRLRRFIREKNMSGGKIDFFLRFLLLSFLFVLNSQIKDFSCALWFLKAEAQHINQSCVFKRWKK